MRGEIAENEARAFRPLLALALAEPPVWKPISGKGDFDVPCRLQPGHNRDPRQVLVAQVVERTRQEPSNGDPTAGFSIAKLAISCSAAEDPRRTRPGSGRPEIDTGFRETGSLLRRRDQEHAMDSLVPAHDEPDVLTVEDVARLLKIGRNAIYESVGRGELPHRRIGKQIRFSRRGIMRWLDSWSSQGAKEGT